MEADLFIKALKNNYPNLTPKKIAAIISILNDIPSIAKFGDSSSQNMNNWFMVSQDLDVKLQSNTTLICRAGGKSRYNPMKWEDAFNLKEGLTHLIRSYSVNQQQISLGILLTDIWRPVELYEYAKQIEKFERLGISSIAILFSGSSVMPIGWPWR